MTFLHNIYERAFYSSSQIFVGHQQINGALLHSPCRSPCAAHRHRLGGHQHPAEHGNDPERAAGERSLTMSSHVALPINHIHLLSATPSSSVTAKATNPMIPRRHARHHCSISQARGTSCRTFWTRRPLRACGSLVPTGCAGRSSSRHGRASASLSRWRCRTRSASGPRVLSRLPSRRCSRSANDYACYPTCAELELSPSYLLRYLSFHSRYRVHFSTFG